jgi:iron complex outermembrane recepter protein
MDDTSSVSSMGKGLVAAALAAYCGAGAAQDVAPSSSALEEVVVTARQRAEKLSEVPDSITAFTAEAIEQRGIESIEDALSFVPSVSFVNAQDAGLSGISIRGIGQVRNGEPPVAIVIDGVQLSSPDQIKQALTDVERIEVLKGPQGALYGRNAIGGAIVIETKRPSDHLSGRATLTAGNGNERTAEGVLSGPIAGDVAGFRLVAGYTDFDGVIDNVTLDRKVDFHESRYMRGKLLVDTGGPWSLDLTSSWSDFDGGASWYIPLPDGRPNDTSIPVEADELGRSTRELRDISAKVDVDLGGVQLRSVTAASKVEVSLFEDLDWTAQPLLAANQDREVTSWSQELRLTSGSDQRVRWVGGVYYLDADRDIDTTVLIPPRPFVASPAVRSTESSQASAAFGQANIDLSDALELTLALRYDRDRRTLTDRLAGGERSNTFDAWQPKVSLAYRLDDATLYATAARGFRSGGFNAPNTIFAPIYDAEIATSYELGSKTTWLDGRLQADAAVFLTRYDDQQQFILSGATQGIVNVKESEIRGVELELRAKPTRNFELAVALSTMDSEIKNFDGSRTFVGNEVPLTYGWSSNVSAQYSFDVGRALVSLWAGYERRADQYWHIDNADKQEVVDLTSARITADLGSWRATLWAQNLLDKKYTEEFFANEFLGLFSDIRYPGTPRRYGLSVTYQF